jgi:hypothetical protein
VRVCEIKGYLPNPRTWGKVCLLASWFACWPFSFCLLLACFFGFTFLSLASSSLLACFFPFSIISINKQANLIAYLFGRGIAQRIRLGF